ncbi:hypothetical protein AYO44_01605 [Planctomycetaceae bacterium SCGC AG-212-F19]|nr:hypothetical protein AYO44_01605 [Planctomycetaceae bacterium SCGC AG-212-F19]
MGPSSPRKWVAAVAVLASAFLTFAPLHADEPSLRQTIDAQIRAGLEQEKLGLPGRADDAIFVRRVYLDLVGSVPSYEETVQFLQDSTGDKRAKLIDKLLDDPRFAEHQADVWDLVFFGRHPSDPDVTKKRELFVKWLREKFAKNEPYDKWVRELLVAEGNTADTGPPLFFAQYRNQPEEMAVAVTRLFLGTQLQCARCHDHPFERWKQLDFYGMAGFFARVAFVEVGGGGKRSYYIGEKNTGEVLFSGPAAQQAPGKKGTPVAAKFLGGNDLEEPALPKDFKEPDLKNAKNVPKPLFSRREKLADWVVAKDNPYFARAVANRVWAQFMGRGLVNPIDDLSEKKKPSHPELLDALTAKMLEHNFDLKWYIREIVNSEAYQVTSRGTETDAAPRYYNRARVRPLSAEEVMASLLTVTASAGEAKKGDGKMPGGGEVYFLQMFGEPTDGRGDFQANLSEHLFMNNGSQLRALFQRKKGNLADTIASSTAPWEERVDRLFLSVLNRPPREEERKRFVAHLTSDPKTDGLIEEVIWVLINCAEFRFNK